MFQDNGLPQRKGVQHQSIINALNTWFTAHIKNEHVGIIERSIYTINEYARATCHRIPLKR